MSKKLDNYRIGKEKDRRIKLTNEDKEYILHLYNKEKMPIRAIARIYEKICSRRSIQFVIFPERLKEMQKKHIEEKHHLKYYNKEKWKHYMQGHRDYKRKLIKQSVACGKSS